MSLKPQDVLVLLKLAIDERPWTFSTLAQALSMSPSEVHNAVRRARKARLLDDWRPNREALLEFLVHGVRYAFAAERGALTRGIPTAHAASPLADEISPDAEPPPVWPDPSGNVRGQALLPLYKAVPPAARADPELYDCLALVDAIRAGRARERALAAKHLRKRLSPHGSEAA